jgi:hypothetical protein
MKNTSKTKYTNLKRGQIVKIKYYDDLRGEEHCEGILLQRVKKQHKENNPKGDPWTWESKRWRIYILEDKGGLYKVGAVVSLFENDLERRTFDIR